MLEGANAGDLNMYYSETYVGFRVGGHIVPFYVRGVTSTRSGPKFVGHIVNWDNGEDRSAEVLFGDDNLILETPEIGYAKVGRSYVWLTLAMTQRSTKKGLTSRRLDGEVRLNDAVALEIYKRHEEVNGDYIRLHFHRKSGTLEYKGVPVGTISDNTLSLKRKFRYLTRYINRIYSRLSITEVE